MKTSKTFKTFAILSLATTFALGPVSSALAGDVKMKGWNSKKTIGSSVGKINPGSVFGGPLVHNPKQNSNHNRHDSHHSSHGDVWGAAVGGTMLGLMLGSMAAQPARPAARPQVVVIQQPAPRPRASASSFDPVTGRTTSAFYNAVGNVEIVVTDINGNLISRRVRDRRVGASSYNPATGQTTSSYRQADGSVQVTTTDSSGNVINQYSR